MKIVNIEEDFHPLAGYQLNILAKYFSKMGHEVVIVTSEIEKMKPKFLNFFGKNELELWDREYENKYGVSIKRMPVYGYFNRKNFYKFGIFKYIKTLIEIKKMKPDILFIHGNEQTISILSFLLYKFMKVPYITDDHMVAMALEGNKRKKFFAMYKKYIAPILVKNGITDIRTQNEDFVEKYLGIPLSQAPWISVGSDTMLFHPDINVRKKFRNEYQISEDEFVVIYAGKLDWEKGGLLLADTFIEKFSEKAVTLIVVGTTSNDEYGNKVEETFKQSQNRILRFPTQNYENLAKFYQSADLGVFPRQCSLSFYDIEACGVPVVSEDNNINVDRLQFGNGLYFKSGEVEDFRNKIRDILELSASDYKTMSDNSANYVKNNYNYETIAKDYMHEILESIRKYNEKERGR